MRQKARMPLFLFRAPWEITIMRKPPKTTKTIAQRFWPKVDKRCPDECWPWTASVSPAGYGMMSGERSVRRMPIYAHRVAWELHNGRIDNGLNVCHRCDNPPCCNPAHLFLGTKADNSRDRNAKGRQARGPKLWSAKLTETQIIEIRASSESQRILGQRYGVSGQHISGIRTKRFWRHI